MRLEASDIKDLNLLKHYRIIRNGHVEIII